MMKKDGAFEFGIFQTSAYDVEDKDCLLAGQQDDARRVVGKLIAAKSCVPAHDELVAWLRRGWRVVELEPGPFDQIAADRNGGLLILRSKLHRTHRGFQFVERRLRLPLGMEEVANASFVTAVPAEGDDAFVFCDRGKIEMSPDDISSST